MIILLPQVLPTNRLLYLAALWSVYSFAAAGLAFVYGHAGQLSVAHAAVWGVGAYVGGLLLQDYGVTFWLALPAGGVAGALVAFIFGYPALRLSGIHFVITTFGLGEFLRVLGNNWTGLTGGANGLLVLEPVPTLGSIEIRSVTSYYYLTFALIAIFGACTTLLLKSRVGLRLTALRENELLAQSLGVNTSIYKALAFMISGAYAGVAGVVYAYLLAHIEPDIFGANASLIFVFMVVLGAARSIWGPIAGAAIWVFLPETLHFDPVSSQLLLGVLIIIVTLIWLHAAIWQRLGVAAWIRICAFPARSSQ